MNRQVTITDVAEAAGVSRAAVSKVIRNAYGVSEEMRDKVQRTIDRLGYRPRTAARTLRGSSYTIGVELPTIANRFFDQMISGVTSRLAGTQYQVILAPTAPNLGGTYAVERLADRQVDGIIAATAAVDPEWLEAFASNVPLVLIGRHDNSINYDTVAGDDTVGAEAVVEHLAQLGHQRICHLTVAPPRYFNLPQAPHAVRRASFERAMRARGLVPQVAELDPPTEDKAYQTTLQILDQAVRPTAIFAGHDELAIGTLRALADRGIGPDQVSVVGYDDTDIARHPLISLSSVDQSGSEMGALATTMLLERLSGRAEASHHLFSPALKARRSSSQTPAMKPTKPVN